MRASDVVASVPRHRLLARVAESTIVVVEAPGGYGKSTFVRQAARSFDLPAAEVVLREPTSTAVLGALIRRSLATSGLADLAAALDPTDPTPARFANSLEHRAAGITLIIDDVHHLDPDGLAWLQVLANATHAPNRLLIGGRRVGAVLATLADAHHLRAADLTFDEVELKQLLASAGIEVTSQLTTDVRLRSLDWPALASLIAARLARSDGPEAVARAALGIGALIDDQVALLDDGSRMLIGRLAQLPLLSAEVATTVGGPGTLDVWLDSGLPLHFRSDGWGEVPDSARQELLVRLGHPAGLDHDTARAVADLYRRRGEVAEAASLLHRIGDLAGLVRFLADLSWPALGAVGVTIVEAMIADIPDDLLAEHVGLVARATVAAEADAGRLNRDLIDRADRIAPSAGAGRRAIDAEFARSLGQRGDLAAGRARADVVLATVDANAEPLTAGRAHLHRAILRIVEADGGRVDGAQADLESAIGRFRLAGESRLTARALQVLGSGFHSPAGAFAAAEGALREAADLLSRPDHARSLHLTYLGEAQVHRGRYKQAEITLEEATSIGLRLGSDVILAYAAWVRATIAGERGDAAGVREALDMTRANWGPWYETLAGIDFHANAAELLMRVGDLRGALRELAIAEQRSEDTGYVRTTRLARARFEALHGDPDRADRAVAEVEAAGSGRDRWLCVLLRAVACRRRGEADEAALLLRQAEQAADALDEVGRLSRVEPALRAAAGGSEPSTAGDHALRITMLGGFAVTRGGNDATPPPGRPSLLVKALAIRGPMTLDAAGDLLWPEADAASAAARLRNLLHRIRAVSGDLVRRVEGGLGIDPTAGLDVAEFEELATEALNAIDAVRPGLARRALAARPGPLLPTDLYIDWLDGPRDRIRARHLALLDVLAADGIGRNDLDDALRALDDAIAVDPLTPRRHALAADALARQGRLGAAAEAITRGRRAAAELGLAADADIEAAATRLAHRGVDDPPSPAPRET